MVKLKFNQPGLLVVLLIVVPLLINPIFSYSYFRGTSVRYVMPMVVLLYVAVGVGVVRLGGLLASVCDLEDRISLNGQKIRSQIVGSRLVFASLLACIGWFSIATINKYELRALKDNLDNHDYLTMVQTLQNDQKRGRKIYVFDKPMSPDEPRQGFGRKKIERLEATLHLGQIDYTFLPIDEFLELAQDLPDKRATFLLLHHYDRGQMIAESGLEVVHRFRDEEMEFAVLRNNVYGWRED